MGRYLIVGRIAVAITFRVCRGAIIAVVSLIDLIAGYISSHGNIPQAECGV